MNGFGVKPTKFVLCTALSSCAKTLNWRLGIQIHAYMIRSGYKDNLFLSSALVDFYAKCDAIVEARKVFSGMKKHDQVSWTSLIFGFSINGQGRDALLLFKEINLAMLLQGRLVHSLAIKMGSQRNVFVASALIDMYSKGGDIDAAEFVLAQTPKKNSVLWTSIIMGYAQCGRGSEALELFDRLLSEQMLVPDHICFTAVLTACNHAGFLDKGVEYFNKMRTNYGLSPDIDQYACLIDLYARNGNLRKARDLIEQMPCDPNYVIWSSFLSSCKIYGEVELGSEAANKLIKMEPYNAAPYLTLAHIYARKGLWNEVAEIRSLMHKRRIRKPAGLSLVEVDL
ncbi:putative tetratricopeptide-like helical domain-containing protein [Lupinus albus]|uniref:Putative tetratricopeptide-like helical domain-containing protein n=1 Tax=Lupinus albus TaxID=3870 RepID=A0A6A4NG19_LUPAL|nr:putative tetratricopeptide-like helical domain-containing protein [Lupinus albus]